MRSELTTAFGAFRACGCHNQPEGRGRRAANVTARTMVGGITVPSRMRARSGRSTGRDFAVIGIVLVLLLLCPPLLQRVIKGRRLPYYVGKQMAELKSIETALELVRSELGYYPPSDAMDEEGRAYCGAMKLCEAAMGQDLMGVHPRSRFRRDGTDDSGGPLYDSNTLKVREGPYLPIEIVNAYRLRDLYKDVGPFDGNEYVLCDVWRRVTHIGTGKKVGVPVLYYKARASKTAHDINDPNNPENIYDYRDNHALLALGVPGKPEQRHPLFENPRIFYEMTRDYKVTKLSRPNRADTFILLSAGYDGLYGTQDDVANFDMRWKRK